PDGLGAAGRDLQGSDLVWVLATWVVWFFVDDLVYSSISEAYGRGFAEVFFDDFAYYTVSTVAVLALSPLLVLAAERSAWFLPLLVVPLLAVFRAARTSLGEQHKSLHDPLTGLPNRKLLLQRLTAAVSGPRPEPFVLCLLDLDRFKEVNDTLGHQVGDVLLTLVSHRLRSVLRSDDVVARLGGDEFALFLPGL